MRVFHGVIEIAGQMGILSKALKREGHVAIAYNIFHSYLNYKEHIINTTPQELQNIHRHLINFFDVFHFHYAQSLLSVFRDLEIIRGKGKRMLMHHWGNDVRFHDQARINNPHVYTGDSPPNDKIRERLLAITDYVKDAVVQDFEVRDYVAPFYERVHVVPIAIDLSRFPPTYPDVEQRTPLVIHAPTNPQFKGTDAIEAAIEKIKKDQPIDYRRVQNMSHQQAAKLYRQADIIVDQIRCGSYGLFSVEGMALGKPAVAYIRDDLVPHFPSDLPVVNANPSTIEDKLRTLIEDPEKRNRLGMQGRAYVEKYHASDVVVQQLLGIYEQLSS